MERLVILQRYILSDEGATWDEANSSLANSIEIE